MDSDESEPSGKASFLHKLCWLWFNTRLPTFDFFSLFSLCIPQQEGHWRKRTSLKHTAREEQLLLFTRLHNWGGGQRGMLPIFFLPLLNSAHLAGPFGAPRLGRPSPPLVLSKLLGWLYYFVMVCTNKGKLVCVWPLRQAFLRS